ncbi:hypothetical protein [Mucilaginibacter galii]|nr:hypothetical protein [Mucilaginibacter galii]
MIKQANNQQLQDTQFAETVRLHSSIKAPKVERDKLKVESGIHTVRNGDTPFGSGYKSGDQLNAVSYTVPLSGDKSLLEAVTPVDGRNSWIDEANNLRFRYLTDKSITGNETLVKELKDTAEGYITKVEQAYETVKSEIESFNTDTLKNYVLETLLAESGRRETESSTLKNLNPNTSN